MSCITTKNVYNFKIVAGTTLERTMTFTHAADGTPYDLSIYDEIRMQVRKYAGDTIVASGALSTGEFTVVGNALSMIIQMPDLVGVYKYDIEFTTPDTIKTLVRGEINILEQITKITV